MTTETIASEENHLTAREYLLSERSHHGSIYHVEPPDRCVSINMEKGRVRREWVLWERSNKPDCKAIVRSVITTFSNYASDEEESVALFEQLKNLSRWLGGKTPVRLTRVHF